VSTIPDGSVGTPLGCTGPVYTGVLGRNLVVIAGKRKCVESELARQTHESDRSVDDPAGGPGHLEAAEVGAVRKVAVKVEQEGPQPPGGRGPGRRRAGGMVNRISMLRLATTVTKSERVRHPPAPLPLHGPDG